MTTKALTWTNGRICLAVESGNCECNTMVHGSWPGARHIDARSWLANDSDTRDERWWLQRVWRKSEVHVPGLQRAWERLAILMNNK